MSSASWIVEHSCSYFGCHIWHPFLTPHLSPGPPPPPCHPSTHSLSLSAQLIDTSRLAGMSRKPGSVVGPSRRLAPLPPPLP
eukprot:329855-Chlamydomonas_euryale.AAC.1